MMIMDWEHLYCQHRSSMVLGLIDERLNSPLCVSRCSFVQNDNVDSGGDEDRPKDVCTSRASQRKKGGSSADCSCYSVCNNTEKERNRMKGQEEERERKRNAAKLLRQTMLTREREREEKEKCERNEEEGKTIFKCQNR